MPPRFTYDTISADDFKQRLDALNMPPHAFARITGAQDRTVDRWLADERNIPPWVHLVLHLFENASGSIPEARNWAAETIREDYRQPGIEYPYSKDQNDE